MNGFNFLAVLQKATQQWFLCIWCFGFFFFHLIKENAGLNVKRGQVILD